MSERSLQIFISFKTILSKEITRFMRIWTQTLLPPVIMMTLYFVIFGKLLGAQIQTVSGHSYIQYLVPGLIMMSIINNAYANTSSSFFGAKFSKSIEEIMVAPVPPVIIMLGYCMGGVLRGLLVGIAVLLISLLFTHINITHFMVVFGIALFSAMIFSLAGLINAIYAKKFDDVSFIPVFVLTPLTYLGGVFYSIKQLPPIWQTLSMFNPIVNIVDTFRYGILGTSDVNLYLSFSIVGILLIALIIWSLRLLQKGTGLRS